MAHAIANLKAHSELLVEDEDAYIQTMRRVSEYGIHCRQLLIGHFSNTFFLIKS